MTRVSSTVVPPRIPVHAETSSTEVPIWYAEAKDPAGNLARGLDPAVAEERMREARHAMHGAEVDFLPLQAPSYFRTYEEVKEALFALAQKYPELVEVVDIGDTSEKVRGVADRDIYMLRLTEKGDTQEVAKRPKLFWTGGMHAREIANPELLLRWATTILENFGKDPEATALLKTRLLDIVVMVNADGHAEVERSYTGRGNRMQRKNTAPPNGTDLNRNFSFQWGGPGASSNPRNETYRGPSPASEPEIQALEKQIAATDYAMHIDWHSYSELVLFPWGHTRERAPDYEGLKAVAERFASFNGYTPQPGVELYPTSGTSEGPSYGQKRIPAFTLETGRSFHQSDAEWERVRRETWPVMTYAAKIADAPYERAKGPSLARVKVNATTGRLTAEAATAVTSATLMGARPRSTMVAAEYVLDPTVPAGQGTSLLAADGSMDQPQEALVADVSHLLEGGQGRLIYVRARDSEGNWGPLSAQWIVPPAQARDVAA